MLGSNEAFTRLEIFGSPRPLTITRNWCLPGGTSNLVWPDWVPGERLGWVSGEALGWLPGEPLGWVPGEPLGWVFWRTAGLGVWRTAPPENFSVHLEGDIQGRGNLGEIEAHVGIQAGVLGSQLCLRAAGSALLRGSVTAGHCGGRRRHNGAARRPLMLWPLMDCKKKRCPRDGDCHEDQQCQNEPPVPLLQYWVPHRRWQARGCQVAARAAVCVEAAGGKDVRGACGAGLGVL